MLLIGYNGELIPNLNSTSDVLFAVCKDAEDCRKMVNSAGWQTDFSCKEYDGGLYHFDEMVGTIRRLFINPATLIVALTEMMEVY